MHDRCPLMVMSAPFVCTVLPIIKTANQGKIMVSSFFVKFFGKTDIFHPAKGYPVKKINFLIYLDLYIFGTFIFDKARPIHDPS